MNRQVFRQQARQLSPLLFRPGDEPHVVDLTAAPADLARAGALSAQLRFPVDAAIGLAIEALAAAGLVRLNAVLRTLPALPQRAPSPGLRKWADQLAGGCLWHEDHLPRVVLPTRLGGFVEAHAEDAVRLAGDAGRLPLLLATESAAVASNARLGAFLLAQSPSSLRR
jgi:hypothetical protein